MITLEGINVYSIAWYTIMDVSKATYYHWKINANNGMHVDQYNKVGITKLEQQNHKSIQATATMHLMLIICLIRQELCRLE
jgi:hypothetical protein